VNFPPDRRLACDASTDSSTTGIPTFSDVCDGDVDLSEFDTIVVQPPEQLCPGDTIITRTWTIRDSCGNSISREQTLVVSVPEGPCTPTPCPPCDDVNFTCCPSSLVDVPCVPVPCNPVQCTTTSCSSVPCLPVVCGNGAPPPFADDDDDTVPPTPRPAATACEPVYIYIFDDSDSVPVNPPVVVDSNSSAGSLSVSMLVVVLVAMLLSVL